MSRRRRHSGSDALLRWWQGHPSWQGMQCSCGGGGGERARLCHPPPRHSLSLPHLGTSRGGNTAGARVGRGLRPGPHYHLCVRVVALRGRLCASSETCTTPLRGRLLPPRPLARRRPPRPSAAAALTARPSRQRQGWPRQVGRRRSRTRHSRSGRQWIWPPDGPALDFLVFQDVVTFHLSHRHGADAASPPWLPSLGVGCRIPPWRGCSPSSTFLPGCGGRSPSPLPQ